MATSLRGILAYAGHLASQFPFQLSNGGVQNPLSNTDATTADDAPLDGSSAFAPVTPYEPLTGSPSCPVDGPVSCNNDTGADSCCFVHPGGRLLLTQFWDEELHVGGAETDWTMHGLWPDLCDGSYKQYCGMTPHFNHITQVLQQYDQGELVKHMNRYWVANYGSNENLWAHEYNKHASCINTLAPSCYGSDYQPGLEVVDYFARAFGLFRTLDTYRALQAAGIEPDVARKYDLADVEAALAAFSGGRVVLKCGGRHRDLLHEAWYVYFVKGSLQSGQFVPAQDSFRGDGGNCASRVRYMPKRLKGRSA